MFAYNWCTLAGKIDNMHYTMVVANFYILFQNKLCKEYFWLAWAENTS